MSADDFVNCHIKDGHRYAVPRHWTDDAPFLLFAFGAVILSAGMWAVCGPGVAAITVGTLMVVAACSAVL